ncbi:MAG: 1,4-dihydroxy-6-naphthoate synthase [Bacteroidetes bacterium]|nr:1,4-dihydroxy-6-naphthoate synthase [Bacteroidota bacterium]
MPDFEIGFSPCPNDTFIFDALVNHKIDTKGYTFNVHLQDVQTLNEWAIAGKLPFSKISYGVWPMVKNNYSLLNSGGALGKGVGPLLVYKEDNTRPEGKPDASTMRVAIPGVNTTAHLLFSLAFPNVTNKEYLVFNEIENAVLNGKVDAGVIIHENRFTYADKGLSKWIDLGTYFEETFNAPIPLGGIIARNDINANEIAIVDDLIKQSVEYAFANSYDILPDYVKCHSQEMSEQVMRQHIDLYVNDFTIDMGDTGRKAIAKLVQVYNS